MYNYQLNLLIEAIYGAQGMTAPTAPPEPEWKLAQAAAKRDFLASDTRAALAQAASELITAWPQLAFPVVQAVTIVGKRRGDDLLGRAEVYRVWPLGQTYEVTRKDGTDRAHVGVTRSGRAVEIADTPDTPSVAMREQLQWKDVPDAAFARNDWSFTAHGELVAALQGLKARSEPSQTYSPLPIVGAPVSAADAVRSSRLFNEGCALMGEIAQSHRQYGSRSHPSFHGPATRPAAEAWKQCDKAIADLRNIDKKLDKLGYTDRRPWQKLYSA